MVLWLSSDGNPIEGLQSDALRSPPRDWPACFKADSSLKSLVRTLKGKRARLVDAMPPSQTLLAPSGARHALLALVGAPEG